MDWRRIGDKPLSEPKLTQFNDEIWASEFKLMITPSTTLAKYQMSLIGSGDYTDLLRWNNINN